MENNKKEEDKDSGEGSSSIPDVGVFSQAALQALVLAIKRSHELPSSGDDFDYYSSFKGFRRVMQVERSTILDMMKMIFKQSGINVQLDVSDMDEMFDSLVEANDTLLERVGSSLDVAAGYRKTEDNVVLTTVRSSDVIKTSWNRKIGEKHKPIHLLAARNVSRPQLKFKTKVDNTSEPFVPIITEKPNSLKPLAILLEDTPNGEMYSHPYQYELDRFDCTPQQLQAVPSPTMPLPVEATPYEFVKTSSQLPALLSHLSEQTEFAVDLEHHSYRSFQGITCLMQISTSTKDFLIDTIELRADLQLLNEVFTHPKIVKVLHGADSDVEWLQRDLGIYVVNMFDTGQASRMLNHPQHSLAYQLKLYCQVDANKQYQLADWRIRPLPAEMVKYAREDTHYLLYIYHRMKNALLEQSNGRDNLLRAVIHSSRTVCEKRYEKPVFTEDSYLQLYKKGRKVFNSRQIYALQELYRWRDRMARQEDESIGYVLPNHMMLQIAEVLPREQQGVLACCNPIPPLVRQQLMEIHKIILTAREKSLVQAEPQQVQVDVSRREQNIDLDNTLHCPHDLAHPNNDGPALLDNLESDNSSARVESNDSQKKQVTEKSRASIPMMDSCPSSPEQADTRRTSVHSSMNSFTSPYERFKLVQPFEEAFTKSEELETSEKERIERLHQFFKQLTANTREEEALLDKMDVLPNGEEEEEVKQEQEDLTELQDGTSLREVKNLERKRKRQEDYPGEEDGVTEVDVKSEATAPLIQDTRIHDLMKLVQQGKTDPSVNPSKSGKKRKKMKGNRQKLVASELVTPYNYSSATTSAVANDEIGPDPFHRNKNKKNKARERQPRAPKRKNVFQKAGNKQMQFKNKAKPNR